MPRAAFDLSTGEALQALAASERTAHGRKKGGLKKRVTGASVDSAVDGLLDIIGSLSDDDRGEDEGEAGGDIVKGKQKRKSKKRLREEATAASADLQRLAAEAEGAKKGPESSMFYRYIPVGRAFTDCLKTMKARGFLKEESDGKLLRLFDDAVKEITENSEMTLSVPDLQRTSGRSSSSSKNIPTFEGTLASYNNYKNNWQLEVEDVVIHRDGEVLFDLPRGKIFIKADDSKPSIRARTSR